MRQKAVSNQPAKLLSPFSSIGSNKVLPQVMKNRTDDPTKAHPVPIGRPRERAAPGRRSSQLMTSESFKKKYSGLAHQAFPGGITKLNIQKTVLDPNSPKSQFCPAPDSVNDNGSELIKKGPKHRDPG
jgi:hypothetical protein